MQKPLMVFRGVGGFQTCYKTCVPQIEWFTALYNDSQIFPGIKKLSINFSLKLLNSKFLDFGFWTFEIWMFIDFYSVLEHTSWESFYPFRAELTYVPFYILNLLWQLYVQLTLTVLRRYLCCHSFSWLQIFFQFLPWRNRFLFR